MTTLFGGAPVINVNVNGSLVPQSFIGTGGQTLFNITNFTYNIGTNSLMVWINGVYQRSGRDYTETSSSSFTLLEGVVAGDKVDVIGFPQVTLFFGDAGTMLYTAPWTGASAYTQKTRNAIEVCITDFPGVDTTGVTDSWAGLALAHTFCYLNGYALRYVGSVNTTQSIPYFHQVRKAGTARILRNGANTFGINGGSALTNNLYVSPTGNDGNDGLSATEPFKTPQACHDTGLLAYGPVLPGNFAVNLAAGTQAGALSIAAGLASMNYLVVQGPAVVRPAKPTCTFDIAGSGTTSGIVCGGNNKVLVRNVNCTNWISSGNGSGVVAQDFSILYTQNVWADNCDNGIKWQQSRAYVEGGIITNCAFGMESISGSTHTIGYNGSIQTSVSLPVVSCSGNGTSITVTFAVQSTAPVVGSYFVMQGMTPSGYNGLYLVTASTTSSVTLTGTATGATTVLGNCGYNFNIPGTGPLVFGSTTAAILLQENATGHVDYTTAVNSVIGIDAVASSRANCNFSSFAYNVTAGTRRTADSNILKNSCLYNNNGIQDQSGSFSLEMGRERYFTSELMLPIDQIFVPHTGTITADTIKTYPNGSNPTPWIAANQFSSGTQQIRVRLTGDLSGVAGTKNITVNLNGSAWFGFTIPAAYTGTYIIDAIITGRDSGNQTYDAVCWVNGNNPLTASGARSIALNNGSDVTATIVNQNGSAADTVNFRAVRVWEMGC